MIWTCCKTSLFFYRIALRNSIFLYLDIIKYSNNASTNKVKSFIELVWIIQEKSLTLQCQTKTTNNYGKRNQKI